MSDYFEAVIPLKRIRFGGVCSALMRTKTLAELVEIPHSLRDPVHMGMHGGGKEGADFGTMDGWR